MGKEFHKVAHMSDLKLGAVLEARAGRRHVALCNVGGQVYAIADVCSHDGGTLADGDLDGETIECPRHGARFNVRTGQVEAPPAVVPVDTYEVKIQGNDILVAVES